MLTLQWQFSKLTFAIGLSIGSIIYQITQAQVSQAQIVPDNTLANPSILSDPSCRPCRISGGSQSSGNLFHSFQQFSIRPGEVVLFETDPTVTRVFSRITGSQSSEINGFLGALRPFDLFLLNPNGIIIGSDARLRLQGSLIGTTAQSFQFADGFEFSATAIADSALTISVPTGLQFGQQVDSIIQRDNRFGFQVPPKQTLALVGGAIQISNSRIISANSRIELGSVAPGEQVGLEQVAEGWAINGGGVRQFGNIRLSEAVIGVEGTTGGAIQLFGQNISLSEGSQITNGIESTSTPNPSVSSADTTAINIQAQRLELSNGSQILTQTSGSVKAPDILIDVTNVIQLSNLPSKTGLASSSRPSGIFALVESGAEGQGGNIFLNAPKLNLEFGGQISTSTLGEGNAGNLKIQAQEITLIGREANDLEASGLFAQVEEGASGQGGAITIETDRLEVRDGAQISAAARSAGLGGSIEIQASDVRVSGTATVPFASPMVFDESKDTSNILVSTERDGERASGNLVINSKRLVVEAGGRISGDNLGTGATRADGSGSGDRGSNVTLNIIDELIVREGGQIRTASFGAGVGGSLVVNADTVRVEGSGQVGTNDLTIPSALNAQTTGSGNAGQIRIKARQFDIQDGGSLIAQSTETASGKAGDIEMATAQLDLNEGSITVRSAGTGDGGNLDIQASSNILMRNSSIIETDAGGSGDGGNISISTPFLIGFGNDNSDIIANAISGDGGNITINAQQLFNFEIEDGQARDVLREQTGNDISASSETGTSGTIVLNTLNIDPAEGLNELPVNFIDPSRLIARNCRSDLADNSFIYSGKGGIALGPNGYLYSKYVPNLWIDGASIAAATQSSTALSPKVWSSLQEVQDWRIDSTGSIRLVAPVDTALRHANFWDCAKP